MIDRMKQFRMISRLIGRCFFWVGICASCCVLAGCNGYSSPSSSPSASSGESSSAATAADVDTSASGSATSRDDSGGANADGDGWQLGRETSAMDGELIEAQRTYQFANDSDTVAQVQFICMVQKHQLVIKIGSYVGGIAHPTKESAYQVSVNPITGSSDLDGRIRFGTFDPVAFASYFDVDRFANIAEMDVDSEGEIPVVMSDNGVVDLSLGGILGYYAKLKHINIDGRKLDQNPLKGFASGRNTYNKIAAFGYLFPIAVEIVNGRGTFDFIIDKSNRINSVLNHCDTGKPVLDPSLILSNADIAVRDTEVAQAEQQRKEYQAQQAAQAAAKMNWEKGEDGANLLFRAVESYVADHNHTAPASLQDLLTLPPAAYRPGTTSSNGFHAYATSADLIDPFSHPYGYVRGSQPWMFHIYFYGEDGVLGGTGFNSDCIVPGGTTTCRILPATAEGSLVSATTPTSAQSRNSPDEPSGSGAADRPVTSNENTPLLLSASFDCTKASSPTERAICSDANLSNLNGRVAMAYKQLLVRDPLAIQAQREWLKQRNLCSDDIGCLTSSYQQRLKEIKETMVTLNAK